MTSFLSPAAKRLNWISGTIFPSLISTLLLFSAGCGSGASTTQLHQNSGQIAFTFGPEETVVSYADQCDALDVPDNPAHFIRLADGSLFLDDGDAPNFYGTFGSAFTTLQHDCTAPILVSDDLSSPNTFDNQEWIESAYMAGGVIHGLIHNEFHDPIAPDCKPGDSTPGNPCWYNSITYGVSTDGGHTFTHAPPPTQLLAPAPQQWDPTGPPPPYGYFEPSGIVQAQDAFYYAMFRASARNGNIALCIMRTQTLDDPTSWRAWDGSGFNLQMTNPYTSAPTICSAVTPDLAEPTITFSTYLGKYLLVGSAVLGNPPVCGAAYGLSSDLIHWSEYQIMQTAYFSFTCLPPGGVGYVTGYFSIIDHNDTTVNFEKSGQTPYLYYTKTQWNNGFTQNRDLVRAPVTISQK